MRLPLLFLLVLLVKTTSSALLRRGEPPQVKKDVESNIRVAEGTKLVSINCPVLTSPKNDGIIVTWHKDGEEISTEWTQYKIVSNNRELKIKEPQRQDSGVYTCRAVNGFGHKEVDFFFEVFDPHNDVPIIANESISYSKKPSAPKWYEDQSPSSNPNYLALGEELILRCPAVGNPLPEISWYKDSQLLELDQVQRHRMAKLKINHVSPHDSGTYTCRLENRYGTLAHSFAVAVGESATALKDLRTSFEHANELDNDIWSGNNKNAPVIDDPQNASVIVGHTAKFTCHLTQRAIRVIFRWLKETNNPREATLTIRNRTYMIMEMPDNSTQISENTDGTPIYSNTLTIDEASEYDTGKYYCVITSSDGYVGYRAAYLNVVSRFTDITKLNPMFPVVIVIVGVFFVILAFTAIVYLRCFGRSASRSQNKSSCSSSDCSHDASTADTKKTLITPPCFVPRQAPPPPPRMPPPEAPIRNYSPNKPQAFMHVAYNSPMGSPLLVGDKRIRQGPSMFSSVDRRYKPPYLHRTFAEDEMSRMSSNIYDSGSPLPPPPSHAEAQSTISSHVYCTTSPQPSRMIRVPMHVNNNDGAHAYAFLEQQPLAYHSGQHW